MELTVGRTIGEAVEWLQRACEAHGDALERELSLSATMDNYQKQQDVSLSAGAVLLILVPILERIDYRERSQGALGIPTSDVIDTTVGGIIQGAASKPAPFDKAASASLGGGKRKSRLRTALSVIKQFKDQFCNIPPFCGEA